MNINKIYYNNLDKEEISQSLNCLQNIGKQTYLMIDQKGQMHCIGILRKCWENFKGWCGLKNYTHPIWLRAQVALFLDYVERTDSSKEKELLSIQKNVNHYFWNNPLSVEDLCSKVTLKEEVKENTLKLLQKTMQSSYPQLFFRNIIERAVLNEELERTDADLLQKKVAPLLPSYAWRTHEERLKEMEGMSFYDSFICFYKTGPTEFLGNFAICPNGIQLWNHSFRCAEAAFQWRKYDLAELRIPQLNEFFTCDGERAFALRKELDALYPRVFPFDWKKGRRDEVMWEVLQEKFTQNPRFKEMLQATQEQYLLEHRPPRGEDDYWSDGHDGSGKNMLGKMLMGIRNNATAFHSADFEDCDPFSETVNQQGLFYPIH